MNNIILAKWLSTEALKKYAVDRMLYPFYFVKQVKDGEDGLLGAMALISDIILFVPQILTSYIGEYKKNKYDKKLIQVLLFIMPCCTIQKRILYVSRLFL
jgi:hypothetical protein